MPLGFHNNAIVLSGETGTKLKTSIIADYYRLWWEITSGNRRNNFRNNTSIVEMHAATGEVYIENTGETLLGSAGHAMQLKYGNNPWETRNLKIICVEENDDCFFHLKEVIKRRWPKVDLGKSEGPVEMNDSNLHLFHADIDDAIEKLMEIKERRNSIFFFDPLLHMDWNLLEKVARSRINSYYQTGTEFILFLFTSDWFLGRNEFSPLPSSLDEETWSESEEKTVDMADNLFGHQLWRKYLLNKDSIVKKQQRLVNFYCVNLFRWFRYVLPLPFKPKKGQLYHLFFCSNYEAGINIAKGFYQKRTNNPKYAPSNARTLKIFKQSHQEVFEGIKHPRRPLKWKLLWKIIKQHEFGICDPQCPDFIKEQEDLKTRIETLEWLESQDYLKKIPGENPHWEEKYQKYILNWEHVTSKFKIDRPSRLIPIEPTETAKS